MIKTHEHKFESSGITVRFRNISPLVAVDVRKSMDKLKPQPPVEQIELAGVVQEMPNEDDPDYVDALAKFEQDVQFEINEAYVKRAKFTFDDPDWKGEVDAYRAEMIDTIRESDQWIYITRIISAGEELQQFYDAVNGIVRPSQEAIQASKDSFRADVPAA